MLRIACIGDYTVRYSYFTAGVMEGAIRLGHWFRPIPLKQPIGEISNQVDYFRPDVIFTHQLFGAYHDLDKAKSLFKSLKKRNIKIIVHAGDPKHEPRLKDDIRAYADIGLVNRSNTKPYSDTWKIPCYHWPYFCLYQKDIGLFQEKYRADVSFSGNLTKRTDPKHPHYGRAEFIEAIGQKLKLKLYPNKDIPNSRFLTPVIATSSNAIIGTQIDEDRDGYIDTRPFQYIGAGALYFHERCNAIEQFFKDGIHYVAYELGSVDSFLEKYKYYVTDNPDKGKKIQMAGFVHCQNKYNTVIRIRYALEKVGL